MRGRRPICIPGDGVGSPVMLGVPLGRARTPSSEAGLGTAIFIALLLFVL